MTLPQNFTADDVAREFPRPVGLYVEVPIVPMYRACRPCYGENQRMPNPQWSYMYGPPRSRLFELVAVDPTRYREVNPLTPQLRELKRRIKDGPRRYTRVLPIP